ncbi:hypothetical protein C8R45DRAFT_445956 [Mycena sanguinolenta]|nr:hypothetical protein C8R45DRAFT_445956 [Mycena sanguinolenta]
MFSFFTSSGVVPAVLSCLAVANALCLPCQVGLGQIPLGLKTPSRRGVYDPPITSPGASTTWARQSIVTVTWCAASRYLRIASVDRSSPGPHPTCPKASRIRREGFSCGTSSNEHLDLDHPLAEGFDIQDGNRTIRVPNVPPRDNYIVVLMGSSGNRSPEFKIE